ncbi:MAG: DUF3524 domain-containing protein [Cellvibrionaceae bacterium]|nr:DUF3524 domain-containing protein [Cellvibrionaceae bacterium]
MKVLLLSGYDAQSHQHWRQQLCQGLQQWQWQCLSLPARYFSWRQRGNSLSWAFAPESRAILDQPYDLLLCTSMVDLAALRGFVPALAKLPTLVYFHENQFAYPQSGAQHPAVETQLTSIYSALCGNVLVFNSRYNRDSFLAGAGALLKKMPDKVPAGIVDQLEARARVIPVPLAAAASPPAQDPAAPLTIVWNHRWEYDKGPARLLALLQALLNRAERPSLRFHIVGQRFRRCPPQFEQIQGLLEDNGWLGQWGYLPSRQAYWQCLAGSDVALSTAEHDFQGLAVLEAVAAGALPLVPRRLVYPEWFGAEQCYPSAEPLAEAEQLAGRLLALAQRKAQGLGIVSGQGPDFSWRALGPRYRTLFEDAAGSGYDSAP